MFGFFRNENVCDSSEPGVSNQASCLTETRNIFVRRFKKIWNENLELITAFCLITTIIIFPCIICVLANELSKTQGDVQQILDKMQETEIENQNLRRQIETISRESPNSPEEKRIRFTRDIFNDPDSHPQPKIQNSGLATSNLNFNVGDLSSNIIVKNKNWRGNNRENNRRRYDTPLNNRKTQRQMKKILRRLDTCESRDSDNDQRLKSLEVFKKQSGVQVVHIVPTSPIVDISSPELERIGPWFLAKNGSNYGIGDQIWYTGLSLDESGYSIRFSEPGLFTIYPQIYYHITPDLDETPGPMGYKVFFQKNGISPANVPYRPAPILECATAYPSTVIQTCSAQITRYFEAGDEIFLQHSTKSLPVIEADIEGKTFIEIKKYTGI